MCYVVEIYVKLFLVVVWIIFLVNNKINKISYISKDKISNNYVYKRGINYLTTVVLTINYLTILLTTNSTLISKIEHVLTLT